KIETKKEVFFLETNNFKEELF
ncbi:MAG: Unknown protein, partial [uncultured Aureispira sp.]